jgi:cell wall-associated protease
MERPTARARRARTLVTVLLVLLSAVPATAGTVTLTWSPNPEQDVTGYVVYWGTASGQYSTTVDVGPNLSFQFVEPDPTLRYYFAVAAYNLTGARSELSSEVSTEGASTLALTGIASSVLAPQPVGTPIVFSATTSGPAIPHFRWLVFDGAVWYVAQDWSPSSTFQWTPTVANPNYQIGVRVRPSTSSVDSGDPSMGGTMAFPVAPAVALTSLSASAPPPQVANTTITFTAAATGGVSPHEYKWLVSSGSGWTVAQQWSASNTFTWRPTTANSNYSVGVWVRSAGNTVDAPENPNAGTSMAYAITGGNAIAITSLTANKASPQLVGTKVNFTATASGAASYQFKWWVFNGTAWTVVQEWASSNRLMWTAPASGNYQVLVRVRSGANAAESSGVSMPYSFAASSGNGRGNGK